MWIFIIRQIWKRDVTQPLDEQPPPALNSPSHQSSNRRGGDRREVEVTDMWALHRSSYTFFTFFLLYCHVVVTSVKDQVNVPCMWALCRTKHTCKLLDKTKQSGFDRRAGLPIWFYLVLWLRDVNKPGLWVGGNKIDSFPFNTSLCLTT